MLTQEPANQAVSDAAAVRARRDAQDDVPTGAELAEPNPFYAPWLLDPALARLRAGGEVHVIEARDATGALIGRMPVVRNARHGRFPAAHCANWLHRHCFYGAPLLRAGREEEGWAGLLDALDGARWSGLFLHLRAIDPDGPAMTALIALCARTGRRCEEVHRHERALLRSPLSASAYWAANVRAKKRKELRRLQARLAEHGAIRQRALDDAAELDGWITAFLALEARGWKGASGTALNAQDEDAAFLREICHGALAARALDMLRIDCDDQPIAMLVNFVGAQGGFSFKIASDPDFARFSPGVLIEHYNLSRMLDAHVAPWMDSCAAPDHPMIDSLWGERRTMAQYRIALRKPGLRGLRGKLALPTMRAVERGYARLKTGSRQRPLSPRRAPARLFPPETLSTFSAAYPDRHQRLSHQLVDHPLLRREAIAQLAQRHPPDRLEYNLGTVPIGLRPEDTPANGLSLADTIRTIEANKSWIVLKNVERDPAYGALLDELLAELEPIVRAATGPMVHREAFIFLSSPDSITPFHMDPEHNILMQIEGEKVMHVFPSADQALVPPEQSEAFHAGGHRNLRWDDAFLARADPVHLRPGDALLVPVKAPHFVRNGTGVSVSFSITWRSERSVAEGELNGFNRLLHARGLPRIPVSARPEAQKLARLGYRVLRRLGIGD